MRKKPSSPSSSAHIRVRMLSMRESVVFISPLIRGHWYNQDGLRVKKTENAAGTWKTTYTLYEGDNILMQEQYNNGGRLQVVFNIIVNGQILAQYKRVYPSTDSVVFFYVDHLGSRRVVMNSAGTVIDRYRYSAWGAATQDVGTDDYRSFTGKDYDATGLIYFNARYYDAMTGRFLTEDPARKGGNWYAYCGNNPMNTVDPTGRQEKNNRQDIRSLLGLSPDNTKYSIELLQTIKYGVDWVKLSNNPIVTTGFGTLVDVVLAAALSALTGNPLSGIVLEISLSAFLGGLTGKSMGGHTASLGVRSIPDYIDLSCATMKLYQLGVDIQEYERNKIARPIDPTGSRDRYYAEQDINAALYFRTELAFITHEIGKISERNFSMMKNYLEEASGKIVYILEDFGSSFRNKKD